MKVYEGNGVLFEFFKKKLMGFSACSEKDSRWLDLWSRLKQASNLRERLLAYKAIRDAGVVSPEKGFYLVSSEVLGIANVRIDKACSEGMLKEIDDQMIAVKKAHGLSDDENWPLEVGPKEYESLRIEWDRIYDQYIAKEFREFGERKMGNLYLNDRGEFDRLAEEGRRFFFGPLGDEGDVDKGKVDDDDDDEE